MLILHTTNRHHPFQGEVAHFPFYPWLPGPIRDRILACDVVKSPQTVSASDHLPVVADLAIA